MVSRSDRLGRERVYSVMAGSKAGVRVPALRVREERALLLLRETPGLLPVLLSPPLGVGAGAGSLSSGLSAATMVTEALPEAS